MASLAHVAVGMAAGRLHHKQHPARWMLLFSAFSLAPDLDVIAFAMGIPYEDPFGHRGASHALLVALFGAALALHPGPSRARAGVLGVLVVASHGLLDSLTTGGLGPALFWPFTDARYFAPLRPIPVAPIGRGLLSARGLYVIAVEAVMFSPLLVYALWPRRRATPASSAPAPEPEQEADQAERPG